MTESQNSNVTAKFRRRTGLVNSQPKKNHQNHNHQNTRTSSFKLAWSTSSIAEPISMNQQTA